MSPRPCCELSAGGIHKSSDALPDFENPINLALAANVFILFLTGRLGRLGGRNPVVEDMPGRRCPRDCLFHNNQLFPLIVL